MSHKVVNIENKHIHCFFFIIRQFTTVVPQKSYWVTGTINNVNSGYILHSKYMIISIYYCFLSKSAKLFHKKVRQQFSW